MKKIMLTMAFAIVMLMGMSIAVTAADAKEYFVAADGNDSNAGTIEDPFKSITRAQEVAYAGDTVYIRGGLYNDFTVARPYVSSGDPYDAVHYIYKSGISYVAYPGERPVFDFSAIEPDEANDGRVAAFMIETNVTDVTFKGFDVTGVRADNAKQSECFRVTGIAHFDNVSCYDNEANGFYFTGSNGGGSLINCDSYGNIGPTSSSIGNTDGYGFHGGKAVVAKYCRAWDCSDDGFDTINAQASVILEGCWAFDMNEGGDGNGFKMGGGKYGKSDTSEGNIPNPIPRNLIVNCIAANNSHSGFYVNHQVGGSTWIHNSGYNNKKGNFNMLERNNTDEFLDIAGYRSILHYNVSFSNNGKQEITNYAIPALNATDNSWTTDGLTLAADDFESLDWKQLKASRKADGSLPDINFMKPTEGSTLASLEIGAYSNQVGEIEVQESFTKGIGITSAPDKTEYELGESFSPEGMEVTVTTFNLNTKDETITVLSPADYEMDYDFNEPGASQVTVSYVGKDRYGFEMVFTAVIDVTVAE